MSKIDIDKLVASVYKHEVQKLPSDGQWSTTLWTLDEVLREQGLKYKAGEIVEIEPKFSNVSENGKNCKPANLSKSSKDLQELTEFEMALQATIIGFVLPKKKPSVEDVKYWAKELIDIAYKQFEKAQLNPKLEEYEQLFQRFNEAVDDEIKRRCDAIDPHIMSEEYRTSTLKNEGIDYYNSALITYGVSCYKQGIEDTIKKLKTK